MQYPLITCIVPCYNHSKYVQGALLSLCNDKYPNMRIVCIDDGSTDDSWIKIKESCDKLKAAPTHKEDEPAELFSGVIKGYPIIIARFSKNYGPSAARNYGLKTSWDSPYFQFLDSDDEIYEGKLHLGIEPFLRYPDFVGICYSDYETENKLTGLKCRVFCHPYSREKLVQECIINCNSIIAKNILEKSNLFDESISLCEDYDQWLRMTKNCIAVHIPKPLLKIRVGGDSVTYTKSKAEWERCMRVVRSKI